MKKKETKNKVWCEWCGEFTDHPTEEHTYENEKTDEGKCCGGGCGCHEKKKT